MTRLDDTITSAGSTSVERVRTVRPELVDQVMLRHRSLDVRDGLAWQPLMARSAWAGVREALAAPRRRSHAWSPAWTASLADVVGLQSPRDSDLADATALYDLAAGHTDLDPRHGLARGLRSSPAASDKAGARAALAGRARCVGPIAWHSWTR